LFISKKVVYLQSKTITKTNKMENIIKNKHITNEDFFNYYRSLNKKDQEKMIGLPLTYHIGSDSYATEIKKIERNGRTIITKDNETMTLRKRVDFIRNRKTFKVEEVPTLKYRSKGCTFGSITIGEAYTRLDPHF